MPTQVKVFKGPINSMKMEINTWVRFTGARILNTRMTNDDKGPIVWNHAGMNY